MPCPFAPIYPKDGSHSKHELLKSFRHKLLLIGAILLTCVGQFAIRPAVGADAASTLGWIPIVMGLKTCKIPGRIVVVLLSATLFPLLYFYVFGASVSQVYVVSLIATGLFASVAEDWFARASGKELSSHNVLNDSERRLRAVLDSALDGIIVIDEKGIIESVNPAGERLFQYSKDEMIGRNIKMLMPEPFRSEHDQYIGNYLFSGKQKIIGIGREVIGLRKDGSEFPFDLSVSEVNLHGRRIFSGLVHDVSDRKKAEEHRIRLEAEIQKSHKLESIGILAGGIAHDFNNLLSGLFGYIELASRRIDGGEFQDVPGILKNATGVFNRAKALTQQLLTFSKGGGPLKKPAHMASLIRESATFALSGSNIGLEFNIQEPLWTCEVDKDQITQVIDNIVRNAKEAMPSGGRVSISARNIPEAERVSEVLAPGNYVKTTIKDRGPGIKKHILEHIFDPFFTTKSTGHGLGLSIAYSIIKRHGGLLQVESEEGDGATFHVYLPASLVRVVEPEKAEVMAAAGGKGKVLIMDDEEVLRQIGSAMLEGLGCAVQSASSGEEAVRLFREAREAACPFDLVILDLTVRGGMGGRKAIEELLKLDPHVRAVVSSGYSDDPIMTDPQSFGFLDAIVKPYHASELERVLKRFIAKDRNAGEKVKFLRAV